MGTLTGFVVGYVLGAQQGPEGYAKLRAAWETIIASPEVKALLEQAPNLGELAAQASSNPAGLVDAIASSPTVQSVVSTGLTFAGDVLERGLAMLSQRAATHGHGAR